MFHGRTMDLFSIFRSALVVFLLAVTFHGANSVCPAGWISVNSPTGAQCYKIFATTKNNFNGAQRFCVQQHGYLARDTSAAVHNALKPYIVNTKLIPGAATTFWIGLTDNNGTGGPWRWVGGPVLGAYQHFFNNNRTNTPNKTDCGYIVSAEQQVYWHITTNCGQLMGVICQTDQTTVTQVVTTPAPIICPTGWTPFPLKKTCIRLYTSPKTWFGARQDCQAGNGDLVKIADNAFNGFISSQVSKQVGSYWIGLNDQTQENKFSWLDETAPATFTYWKTNEPNNANKNENCAYLDGLSGNRWNDAPCNISLRYICQRNPTSGVPTPRPPTTPRPNINCPGRWWEDDPNSDNCYFIQLDMQTWLDARTSCQNEGGDLASITSVQEQFYLSARLMSFTANFFWIGANDRATENGFQWSDSSPFSFLNWNTGQPNNAQDSDCVALMKQTGRWDDLPCTARYGYICKKKGRVTSPTPPQPTSPSRIASDKMWGCPSGWIGNRGFCYQFTPSTGISHDDAVTLCASKQATMASIRDDTENKYIFSQLPKNYPFTALWIGLDDVLMENSFMWSDRSPVTYTNWNPGEPNNSNNEDCVEMLSYANGKWNDVPCGLKLNMTLCKMSMSLQPKGTPAIQAGCPANSLGYGALCYSITDQPMTFNNAKNACRGKNGFLATVSNVQIQSFLSAELFGKTASAYWIGLSSTARTYSWANGWPVSFTSWGNTYRGNLNNTCVAMQTAKPTGLWVDTYQCTQALPYICQSPRVGFTTPRPTVTTTRSAPCPAGWAAYGNLCYMAYLPSSNLSTSWMSAKAYCASRAVGATLASVPNANLENFLKNTVIKNVPGVYWIGLNDRDVESGFMWADGSGLTYTHWNQGEPNNLLNREDCVQWTLPLNRWADNYCYIANSFICQAPRGAIVPTTRPTVTPGRNTPQCGNSTNWTQYNGYCYYVSSPTGNQSLVSWFQARLICKDMSAELVSIGSDDENGYVTTMLSRSPVDSFWIGLNDLEQGSYSWTDISPIVFVSWGLHQPDDAYGGEQCVETNSYGQWNDQYCQEKRGYVCKRRPGNATPPPITTPSTNGGCPRDFKTLPSLSRCYYVGGTTQPERKTFNDAIKACELMVHKSQLASVHSTMEEKFLITLVADLKSPAWIGFNDLKVRNRFGWVDNLNVDYTNWGLRQPNENLNDNNPQNRLDCVDMETGVQVVGTWDDKRCGDKYAYICESNKGLMLPTAAPNSTGCPQTYSRFQNSCYKFYGNNAFNWTVAEGYCVSEGGHLVSLDSLAEQAYVEIATQHSDAIQFWVGMSYSFTLQGFGWSNGWPVKFTNWGTGQPDLSGLGMQSCVSHTVDGQWQDLPCVMQLNYMCEINLAPPPTPTPTIPATLAICPKNWVMYGSNCYYFEKRLTKSWSGANYACSMLGAGLVNILSDDEAHYITTMLTSVNLNAWIGLSRGEGLGFAWTDKSPVAYVYWGQNEPNDQDPTMHQDCVRASKNDGTWADTDCFDQNPYICKMPTRIAPSTSPTPYNPNGQNTPYNPNGQNTPYNPNGQNTPYNPNGQNTPYNPNGQNTPYIPNGQNTPYNPNGQNTQGGIITNFNPIGTSTPGQGITNKYVGGINNNNDSSLGGGSIAGIVIGCVAIIAIAVTVMFVARKYFNFQGLTRLPFSSNNSGFDNATYSTGREDKVNLSISNA
ncbi:unnamed protein product [Lymnaea stagnalis]|uniref:C-type lectin domain-containing protein n=1 Tax=Lymnaea stagnalis TaxID=6523 RepID=A0AAV2IB46_LYMST